MASTIAVKVSCLPHYTTDKYPFRKLQPYIRRVYDAFGPKRMFWGSDLSRLPCSYRQSLTYLSEEIPWLTAGDQDIETIAATVRLTKLTVQKHVRLLELMGHLEDVQP